MDGHGATAYSALKIVKATIYGVAHSLVVTELAVLYKCGKNVPIN